MEDSRTTVADLLNPETKGVYSLYIHPGELMLTRIHRWGNSLGLRIPSSFAREARVESGSPVDLVVEGGKLVISPVRGRRYELARLLRQVHPRNLHKSEDFGPPRGKELL